MNSREFGQFLRSRRARVTPAEAGLVVSGARRAAGLRREEVAELASMSADYYRRLEQARVDPPSAQIVFSIGRVLRLSRDERDYLLRLAGHEPSPVTSPAPEAASELRQFVATMVGIQDHSPSAHNDSSTTSDSRLTADYIAGHTEPRSPSDLMRRPLPTDTMTNDQLGSPVMIGHEAFGQLEYPMSVLSRCGGFLTVVAAWWRRSRGCGGR
jgi:transcriptional regulator with XRE-family HTH domain